MAKLLQMPTRNPISRFFKSAYDNPLADGIDQAWLEACISGHWSADLDELERIERERIATWEVKL